MRNILFYAKLHARIRSKSLGLSRDALFHFFSLRCYAPPPGGVRTETPGSLSRTEKLWNTKLYCDQQLFFFFFFHLEHQYLRTATFECDRSFSRTDVKETVTRFLEYFVRIISGTLDDTEIPHHRSTSASGIIGSHSNRFKHVSVC